MLSLEKYLIAKTAKEGNEQDQVKIRHTGAVSYTILTMY